MSEPDLREPDLKTPAAVRQACREGRWDRPTAGLAPGYAQANLVVLPREDAFDFLRFCQRNPKPTPLLEVLDPGDPEPRLVAPGADLRTDLPRYRVYRRGELAEERTDIRDLWHDGLVAFLIGCSFTFEQALLTAGVPVRHIECGCNVPMYRTNVPTVPAGSVGPRCMSDTRRVSGMRRASGFGPVSTPTRTQGVAPSNTRCAPPESPHARDCNLEVCAPK